VIDRSGIEDGPSAAPWLTHPGNRRQRLYRQQNRICNPGDMNTVRVTAADEYDLWAEQMLTSRPLQAWPSPAAEHANHGKARVFPPRPAPIPRTHHAPYTPLAIPQTNVAISVHKQDDRQAPLPQRMTPDIPLQPNNPNGYTLRKTRAQVGGSVFKNNPSVNILSRTRSLPRALGTTTWV